MSIEALAFPFSVGMLAAFNPCGFAMLPTYIGYFIGTGETEQPTRVRAITRGLWVGSMPTLNGNASASMLIRRGPRSWWSARWR